MVLLYYIFLDISCDKVDRVFVASSGVRNGSKISRRSWEVRRTCAENGECAQVFIQPYNAAVRWWSEQVLFILLIQRQ